MSLNSNAAADAARLLTEAEERIRLASAPHLGEEAKRSRTTMALVLATTGVGWATLARDAYDPEAGGAAVYPEDGGGAAVYDPEAGGA